MFWTLKPNSPIVFLTQLIPLVDYYAILELNSSATERDIKVAFRRLAKKYHPDVNDTPSAPEKFQYVYMAYEVLSDPFKKNLYDELKGHNATVDPLTSEFDYDSGFGEWERKAAERGTEYANMRYEQFEEKELKGLDFFYHQLALIVGIFGLFLLGGAALYSAKTFVTAYMNGKIPATYLIGAVPIAAFGLFILWQVIQMTRVLRDSFATKLKKPKSED